MSSSSSEIGNQLERLALAGFIAPKDDKLAAMVEEWGKALTRFEVGQIEQGINWLIHHRRERWWPTVGELLDAIRLTTVQKEEPTRKCRTCDGSKWMEAVPFQSFGQVYTAVRRCPDCGTPPPPYTIPPGSRQALTAAQHRTYLNAAKTPMELTFDQFIAQLRAMGAEQLASLVVRP